MSPLTSIRIRNPGHILSIISSSHDDVIKWKHFPRYWPFVRGIHRSPVNSPHKGQWRGALVFSAICASINSWVSNREAGDLRRHRAHYDVTVMKESMEVVGSSQCHRERCTVRVTGCTCSAVRAPYWHWYSPLFIRPHWSRSEWGLVWKQWLFLRRWIPGRPVWQVGDNRHPREKLGTWGGVVVRRRSQNYSRNHQVNDLLGQLLLT